VRKTPSSERYALHLQLWLRALSGTRQALLILAGTCCSRACKDFLTITTDMQMRMVQR
jgi:hypothetical protein